MISEGYLMESALHKHLVGLCCSRGQLLSLLYAMIIMTATLPFMPFVSPLSDFAVVIPMVISVGSHCLQLQNALNLISMEISSLFLSWQGDRKQIKIKWMYIFIPFYHLCWRSIVTNLDLSLPKILMFFGTHSVWWVSEKSVKPSHLTAV